MVMRCSSVSPVSSMSFLERDDICRFGAAFITGVGLCMADESLFSRDCCDSNSQCPSRV